MLRRRLDHATRGPAPDPLSCPSYEELRARSAVLAYVVGEGHHDETVLALARKFSPNAGSTAVEQAVRDLVGQLLLTIDRGRVVPGPAWLGDSASP